MRAFLALEISPQARSRLFEAIRLLKPESLRVKWVDPTLMHLTLQFFPELSPDQLDPVDSALRSVTRTTRPFSYRLKGLGSFGARGRLRVLWCGVMEGAASIEALQKRVAGALAPLGFPPENRPFSPHLTLGRLREPSAEPNLVKALGKMTDYEAGEVVADRLVLFSSALKPGGPIYTQERSWPFEASS